MKLNILTKYQKEEIKKRKVLCLNCPFNSVNAVELGLYRTDRLDLHCSICECNIDLFTSCLTCTCSIEEKNKENAKNNIKPVPVKWYPIK